MNHFKTVCKISTDYLGLYLLVLVVGCAEPSEPVVDEASGSLDKPVADQTEPIGKVAPDDLIVIGESAASDVSNLSLIHI